MKLPATELAYIFGKGEMRRDLLALLRYGLFLIGVVAVYSTLFRVIMERVEGQAHSWVTAVYWTLVTMTTLGYGELTFQSDLGRLFSVVVLLSGVVLLLVVLPFTFIRFFYAPWLEAQLRLRAPRRLPSDHAGSRPHRRLRRRRGRADRSAPSGGHSVSCDRTGRDDRGATAERRHPRGDGRAGQPCDL